MKRLPPHLAEIIFLLVIAAILIISIIRHRQQAKIQTLQHKAFIPLVLSAHKAFKGIALACPNAPENNVFDYKTDPQRAGASWIYDWQAQPVPIPGIESVPMIWDETHLDDYVGGNSDYLMGFNEPDRVDQANMTPEIAAASWHYIEVHHPDKMLVSPAPGHNDEEWLEEFREEYIEHYDANPRMDALAAHCYFNTADACIRHVEEVIEHAEQWGIESVWVTEYSILRQPDSVMIVEANKLTSWFASNPIIARYAWFTNRSWCMRPLWGNTWDQSALFEDNGIFKLIGVEYSHDH